ncbi:MAG: Holliday junction resolvase-like protein [Vicinamibacteria bacterium]
MTGGLSPLTLFLIFVIAVMSYILLHLHLRIREAAIRKDALRRSQSSVAGKATEHLAALFPEFPFDPRDARFLGSPVDLIVFDGLSAGELREIVFVEVKTGPSAALSTRERRIRDIVSAGRVRWKEIKIEVPDR